MKSRKTKSINSIGLGIGLALTICGASFVAMAADGPHDKAIKARQAMFQVYGFSISILGDMAKGDTPYDADVASEAAANLVAAANLGQSQMWPQGSDNETEGNATNRALPAIWENFPDIIEKANTLKESSAAVAAVAGDGLGALQGVMNDLGASCKGCHDDYRAEKK